MKARPSRFIEHVAAAMDTAVSIQLVETSAAPISNDALLDRARRAFRWFEEVEAVCSRFDPASELSALSRAASAQHTPVPISALLFEVLQVAVAVAEASDGAFDPTLGRPLTAMGFDRNWRTGLGAGTTECPAQPGASWRDVALDGEQHTVRFVRPLTLDLGGVAKGFAIDLAARELADLPHIAINAGGDLFVRGYNTEGRPWRIGIRDPRKAEQLAAHVDVSNAAICTSGDDQRRRSDGRHHLLDPRTGDPASTAASVTVLAPNAVIADALATAAFVLGPVEGLALLEREQVQGLCIDPAGAVHTTRRSPLGTWTVCTGTTSSSGPPMVSDVPR